MRLLQVTVCLWSCCCCCCWAAALPAAANLETEAVDCLRKELNYSRLALDNASLHSVVQDAMADEQLTRSSVAALPQAERCPVIARILEPLLQKRAAFADRVDKLLRDALGVSDWGGVPTDRQWRRMFNSIPKAIIQRVNDWNQGPQPRRTEDILFIGANGSALTAAANASVHTATFSLDRGLTRRRVQRARLHASDSSAAALRGRRLRLLLAEAAVASPPGRVSLRAVTDWLTVASHGEVSVDTTACVRAALRQLAERPSAEELELRFVVDCPDCGPGSWLPLSVMDVTVEEQEASRPRTRRSAPATTTRLCRRTAGGGGGGGVGQSAASGGCCMSSFSYDLSAMPGVISPRDLTISYCTGHCHAQSKVKNTHSGFKQAMAHSRNSGLTYLQKQELSLCCVPDQYRGYKILLGNPNDHSKVEIREIPEVSVESCTCA